MLDYIFRKLAEKAVDTAVDMAADAIKSKPCTKCGQSMGHDARYCPHCGWDQQAAPPGRSTPATPRAAAPPQIQASAGARPPWPPESAASAPAFRMRIEAVFSIKGRTVVAGPIERGSVRTGDRVEVVGGGQRRAVVVVSVESFSSALGSAGAGENVGVCLQDLRPEEAQAGMLLAAPGAIEAAAPMVVRAEAVSRPAPPPLVEAAAAPRGLPQAAGPLPFLMSIDSAAPDEGGGTIVVGRIERGTVQVGALVELIGSEPRSATLVGFYQSPAQQAHMGQVVGCRLAGLTPDEVDAGMVLAAPGSIRAHTQFKGDVFVIQGERNRFPTLLSGSRTHFYFWGRETPGEIQLPAGVQLVNSGEKTKMQITLFIPVALEVGASFQIRDNGDVVGAGKITALLD